MAGMPNPNRKLDITIGAMTLFFAAIGIYHLMMWAAQNFSRPSNKALLTLGIVLLGTLMQRYALTSIPAPAPEKPATVVAPGAIPTERPTPLVVRRDEVQDQRTVAGAVIGLSENLKAFLSSGNNPESLGKNWREKFLAQIEQEGESKVLATSPSLIASVSAKLEEYDLNIPKATIREYLTTFCQTDRGERTIEEINRSIAGIHKAQQSARTTPAPPPASHQRETADPANVRDEIDHARLVSLACQIGMHRQCTQKQALECAQPPATPHPSKKEQIAVFDAAAVVISNLTRSLAATGEGMEQEVDREQLAELLVLLSRNGECRLSATSRTFHTLVTKTLESAGEEHSPACIAACLAEFFRTDDLAPELLEEIDYSLGKYIVRIAATRTARAFPGDSTPKTRSATGAAPEKHWSHLPDIDVD